MERLTSNKSISEMSMYELAHNSCYAKDGNARYMDYETDIDARWLVIKLLDKYADIPSEFSCEDDFDEFMMDSLQYGADSMLGMIAVFYRNLWAMADLRDRLKEYEDLEEQWKLLKLPCAVGDTVYEINKIRETVSTFTVKGFSVSEHGIFVKWELSDGIYRNLDGFNDDEIGKTVFLTREEAEAALKEL